MLRTPHGFVAMALLVAIGAALGLPASARANDAGALIGGLIAGAIVYELLDDDDGYCHSYHYYSPTPYYRPPVYYHYYPRYYYAPPGGVTVWYEQPSPSWRKTRYRDYGRQHEYGDRWRAPSHAQRNVGPPPLHHKQGSGGRYQPPRRYRK